MERCRMQAGEQDLGGGEGKDINSIFIVSNPLMSYGSQFMEMIVLLRQINVESMFNLPCDNLSSST